MICFLSCPDWPVFSDLDNMAPRDHLDNHRVGWRRPKGAGLRGMDFLPVRTKAESSDPDQPRLAPGTACGHRGMQITLSLLARAAMSSEKSWLHHSFRRWLEKRESQLATVQPPGKWRASSALGWSGHVRVDSCPGRGSGPAFRMSNLQHSLM